MRGSFVPGGVIPTEVKSQQRIITNFPLSSRHVSCLKAAEELFSFS